MAVRMQLVASQLRIEITIHGLLKSYGLKIGAIHRNRSAARVTELLEMVALPELSGRSSHAPLWFGKPCARNEKHSTECLPGCPAKMTSLAG
jgi:hypothetical protein